MARGGRAPTPRSAACLDWLRRSGTTYEELRAHDPPTVVFRLRHAPGSPEEAGFLRTAQEELEGIPGVTRFEVLLQTGVKAPYRHSLSMEFADEAAYAGYNEHPSHVGFVQGRWIPEVEEFMELDFEPYEGDAA